MTEREMFDKALEFATKKHSGQFRKGGEPYITHPVTVARYVKEKGFGIDYQIAALFHDLLEDTDATEEEILALSNKDVLEAVKLLTKEEGYIMADYVAKIKNNPIAFQVKESDRLHNLRSATITSTEFKRRYILETVDWYLDFSADIKKAVKDLALSLDEPMTELSFLYKPIEDWKL